jgi:hypothetical protein
MMLPAWMASILLSALAPQARNGRAQDEEFPHLQAGRIPPDFVLDGRLDEAVYRDVDASRAFTLVEPEEGAAPTERTVLRVLADERSVVIAVRCEDTDPSGIVARSVERDANLAGQDRIRILLDTYRDGRSGYFFSVNPLGARVDGLVAQRGEAINSSWDGIWEAKAAVDDLGWSVEVRIPILTLGFREDLRAWGFNLERHIPRKLEVQRWSGARRDYEFPQSSRAGLLTDLPEFRLGVGLSVRPAGVAKYGRPDPASKTDVDLEASLDATQRLAPALLLSLTVNTDFSDTEVDYRRNNLTRFPLFFPEKRSFFLEGSEIYEFGLGLGTDVIPFYSRRIGLVDGRQVPLELGGKLSGRLDETGVYALGAHMGDVDHDLEETDLGVVRVRQDVLEQSSVGMIATAGDPLDRDGAWTAGVDAVYQTSSMFGDKNFLVGLWGLTTRREDLDGASRSAFGGKIDYPNETVDLAFTFKRIGEDFDPSLGFAPRRGIWRYDWAAETNLYPEVPGIQRLTWAVRPTLVTDLEGHWESHRTHVDVLNLRAKSGDGGEVHLLWQGERLEEDFEISDGVVIGPGEYQWLRYHSVLETAAYRPLAVSATYNWGDFYDGTLDEFLVSVTLNPVPLFTLGGTWERNVGRLEGGGFRQDLLLGRVRLNLSPDFYVLNVVQYDSDSRNLGTFTRLRWTVTPESDVFLVYSYNWLEDGGDLAPQSFESALKIQYTFRF